MNSWRHAKEESFLAECSNLCMQITFFDGHFGRCLGYKWVSNVILAFLCDPLHFFFGILMRNRCNVSNWHKFVSHIVSNTHFYVFFTFLQTLFSVLLSYMSPLPILINNATLLNDQHKNHLYKHWPQRLCMDFIGNLNACMTCWVTLDIDQTLLSFWLCSKLHI